MFHSVCELAILEVLVYWLKINHVMDVHKCVFILGLLACPRNIHVFNWKSALGFCIVQ
jgi:hypothetical protein